MQRQNEGLSPLQSSLANAEMKDFSVGTEKYQNYCFACPPNPKSLNQNSKFPLTAQLKGLQTEGIDSANLKAIDAVEPEGFGDLFEQGWVAPATAVD